MAQVRISIAAAHDEGLPPICMCCGAPAALYKRHQFWWHSRWSVLSGLLGSWSYWRATMEAPLCSAHRYHWTWRWVLPLCLFPLPIAAAGALALFLAITFGNDVAQASQGWTYGLGFTGVFVWFVFFQILRHTGVHPIRMDKDSITFTGVADAFAEAVENPISPALPVRAPVAERAIIPEALLVDEEVLDMGLDEEVLEMAVEDDVLDMFVEEAVLDMAFDEDLPDTPRPQKPPPRKQPPE